MAFFPQLYLNMTINQISRPVQKNQSNREKMTPFATFYKPAQYTGSVKYLNRMKIPCIASLNFAISKWM